MFRKVSTTIVVFGLSTYLTKSCKCVSSQCDKLVVVQVEMIKILQRFDGFTRDLAQLILWQDQMTEWVPLRRDGIWPHRFQFYKQSICFAFNASTAFELWEAKMELNFWALSYVLKITFFPQTLYKPIVVFKGSSNMTSVLLRPYWFLREASNLEVYNPTDTWY